MAKKRRKKARQELEEIIGMPLSHKTAVFRFPQPTDGKSPFLPESDGLWFGCQWFRRPVTAVWVYTDVVIVRAVDTLCEELWAELRLRPSLLANWLTQMGYTVTPPPPPS